MTRLSLTCCPAPSHTEGGTIRCVSRRPCAAHTARYWDLLLIPAALIWTLRPWWPNHLGRARDRGHAHTPNLHPCRACALESRLDPGSVAPVLDRHHAGTYVPGYAPTTHTRYTEEPC